MTQASHASCIALAIALVTGFARSQSTERVSLGSVRVQGDGCSGPLSLSADARFVAIGSQATNFTAGDVPLTWDVFIRDRHTGVTECISLDPSGLPGNGDSWDPTISADGRYVAFWSYATNLLASDTNGKVDVFVHDRVNGTVQIASLSFSGAQGNDDSLSPAISADGSCVAFTSRASNLVTGDTNGVLDIFVRDLVAGTTERVSVATGGAQANDDSFNPSISGDGRFVAFTSLATNLIAGDSNGVVDVFVRDRLNGTTVRVSVSSSGAEGNSYSYGTFLLSTEEPVNQLSADGRFVVFESEATNLVAGDTNGSKDIFVHDLLTGTTERASVDSAGVQGNGDSMAPAISADGLTVGFLSQASNLVTGDANAFADVFVHDRVTGTTERVNVDSHGAEADDSSGGVVLSGDGSVVCFGSIATNLVADDTNMTCDTFLRFRAASAPAQTLCLGDGSSGNCPCANNGAIGRGCQNSASTGGALLNWDGNASLFTDTFTLHSAGQIPGALSIFLQGNQVIGPVFYGDGLRCVGGALLRMYVRNAPPGGAASAPIGLELSISARSGALGDVISPGQTRCYQTYYRDSVTTFCPSPQGDVWNSSAGLSVTWGQ